MTIDVRAEDADDEGRGETGTVTGYGMMSCIYDTGTVHCHGDCRVLYPKFPTLFYWK